MTRSTSTWSATDATSFDVGLTAFNDDLLDSGEVQIGLECLGHDLGLRLAHVRPLRRVEPSRQQGVEPVARLPDVQRLLSFVGLYPMPARHGMTPGEIAFARTPFEPHCTARLRTSCAFAAFVTP